MSEAQKLPDWLLAGQADPPAPRGGTGFLSHSIQSLGQVVSDDLLCERYAAKPLFLQGVDPRVKLAVLFAFPVFASFASGLAVLAACAGVALLYAALSGLAMGPYVRRVWAYLPVLLFVFSLPGVSSLFRAGRPLFYLLPVGWFGLRAGVSVSAAGLAAAVRLALRGGISLSFAFLLLFTTRWDRMTAALAALRLPALLVAVLDMAYRYLFALVELAGGMMEARALRTVGRLPAAEGRRFMGRSIAWLFVRSQLWSEDVYDAMRCRGYAGRPAHSRSLRIQAADGLFIVSNVLILLLLAAGEYLV